jgi:hypothetical protein
MEKDASMRDQFFEFVRRFQLYPGALERVASAPWQEQVVDKDLNLYELLPLFRLNRVDGGYFLDKACIISRDPDDWDNDNVGTSGSIGCRSRDGTGWESSPCRSMTSRSTWRMQRSAGRTCRLR